MTDKEVIFNEDLQQDEPCTTCLDIALDAAYSGGFSPFGDEGQKLGVDAEWDSYDTVAALSSGYGATIGFKEYLE